MRSSKVSALLVATALTVAPTSVALAAPTPIVEAARSRVPEPAPVASDAARYAAREAQDVKAAKFEGGSTVVVIGTSTLVIALLVVIIVILL